MSGEKDLSCHATREKKLHASWDWGNFQDRPSFEWSVQGSNRVYAQWHARRERYSIDCKECIHGLRRSDAIAFRYLTIEARALAISQYLVDSVSHIVLSAAANSHRTFPLCSSLVDFSTT